MIRPCYLIVDTEYRGSISTRKLVIETAKLNVITAYSGVEAVETLRRFPALDAVITDARVRDIACTELVAQLKSIQPTVPVVVVGRPGPWECDGADHYLESFDPTRLLDLLKKLEPERVLPIVEQESNGPDSLA